MQNPSNNNYIELFKKATLKFEPYPYQIEFATNDQLYQWHNIPTGMGKTANIILGWVWKKFYHIDNEFRANTPRRLVYCLPMRVLVEQTRDNVLLWLHRLGILAGDLVLEKVGNQERIKSYKTDFMDSTKISVITLMGGEELVPWEIFPENNIIIIGTQDMLLSGALNRGYSISRYRWPMQFGLLNNDSLWVMDEVQLMGPGLTTSIQMESHREYFGTLKNCKTIWMSATFEKDWFKTVDYSKEILDEKILKPGNSDLSLFQVTKIIGCEKVLAKCNSTSAMVKELAQEIYGEHEKNTKTIVIINTVKRAKDLYIEVNKIINKEKSKGNSKDAKVILLHSQFRPPEKNKIIEGILSNVNDDNLIIISTQVIEAGVDISCKTLFTEVAPWQSLIQRFGRCNRYGEYPVSKIKWIDTMDKKNKVLDAPYELLAMNQSKEYLNELNGKSVSSINLPKKHLDIKIDGTIRKKDIFELFDTMPDLSEFDIDISKFVRNSSNKNVFVFWREIDRTNLAKEKQPSKDELCQAPIEDILNLIKDKEEFYSWDWINGTWNKINANNKVYHGQVLMMDCNSGHYSSDSGWSMSEKLKVLTIDSQTYEYENLIKESCSYNDDLSSQTEWKTISQHSDEVVKKCDKIINEIGLASVSKEWCDSILLGARWHDSGKAHFAFQSKIKMEGIPENVKIGQIAKAPSKNWNNTKNGTRKFFRHELVSGLLAVHNNVDTLAAYLAMSHHGKVRLSIKSMLDETPPNENDKKYAKGVWGGDKINETNIGDGYIVPETELNLNLMEIGSIGGEESWLYKAWNLAETIGIFRLAYMESILRASDQRASGGL